MVDAPGDRARLVNRVRRIRGQIDAVEKALDAQQEYASILQTAAAARGAMNGLVAELIDGHIRHHLPAAGSDPSSADAMQRIVEVVRSYLK